MNHIPFIKTTRVALQVALDKLDADGRNPDQDALVSLELFKARVGVAHEMMRQYCEGIHKSRCAQIEMEKAARLNTSTPPLPEIAKVAPAEAAQPVLLRPWQIGLEKLYQHLFGSTHAPMFMPPLEHRAGWFDWARAEWPALVGYPMLPRCYVALCLTQGVVIESELYEETLFVKVEDVWGTQPDLVFDQTLLERVLHWFALSCLTQLEKNAARGCNDLEFGWSIDERTVAWRDALANYVTIHGDK